jgi:hypothetical protein
MIEDDRASQSVDGDLLLQIAEIDLTDFAAFRSL